MKSKLLRELFLKKGLIRIVGAHDALGAKLAEKHGFHGVWSSGLEISTSHAVPDANILTMTEFLSAAGSMNDAVSLPIIADCDTGYGNSNNVIQMVRKYEAAGIAAVCIEDKHFPKVNSFIPGRQQLASVAEFVGKIMAAKNAQKTEEFMVIARVEALIAGWGMDEALKRAHAYADAGADAILIHSKAPDASEIAGFTGRWGDRAPLVVVPTTYPSVTVKELECMGVKMVIYANQGIRAAISAMDNILPQILRDGTTSRVEKEIAPMSEVFEIQGMSRMKEEEAVYHLREDRVIAIIPAAGDHLDEYSMKEIASDIPMAMLDINGKPLLQRQAETLRKANINDIYVVGGYKKEKIKVEGVQVVHNADYRKTGILHSIMCAEEAMSNRALIAYSDILFDNIILKRLLDRNEDIVLAVDGTMSRKDADKKFDLIIANDTPVRSKRSLMSEAPKEIARIGVTIDPDEAHYEYAGLMLLSAKGCKIFKEVFDDIADRYKENRFHESDSIAKASLTDILQEIIDRGHKVSGVEVRSGWMEIHSFDNYRSACSTVK
ncbi:phosphoenolpyruvate mutase [Candidatus Omnitrophota bacterium]